MTPEDAEVFGVSEPTIMFQPDDRAQKFFEAMDAASKAPHCGEHFKVYTRAMLVRATEAGIYTPT